MSDLSVTAAELIAALEQVPPDAHLVKNQVGNLTAFSPDGDYIGYVDIYSAEYVDVR
jgi:hypothetical protein